MARPDKTKTSTSAAAQEARILAALRIGPKTTDELRALGAYQVSARIKGLRDKSFDIYTHRYSGEAVDGYRHHGMARYVLLSEPKPKVTLTSTPRKKGGNP